MITTTILVTALLMLVALAIRNDRTLSASQTAFDTAPSAVDGALRVAHARLARGEIDFTEYRRISAVLHG